MRFHRRPLVARRASLPPTNAVLLACRRAVKADRFLNRFFDFPAFLRFHRRDLDLFNIVDHSYAHLALPADRIGVYCHDLDAFRCLLEPNHERRPYRSQAMTRRILRGFQRASLVLYSAESVGQALRRWGSSLQALLHAP